MPQDRTSNGGRSITVDRSEGDPDVLVFTYQGREIAELHPPADDAPPRTDGQAEWRVTFEAYPETTVLGAPDEPPIDNALSPFDMYVDYLEADEADG